MGRLGPEGQVVLLKGSPGLQVMAMGEGASHVRNPRPQLQHRGATLNGSQQPMGNHMSLLSPRSPVEGLSDLDPKRPRQGGTAEIGESLDVFLKVSRLGAERMGPGMSFHHCGNSLDWDFVVVLARRRRRSWDERRGLAGV
ncbi:unnamed protein product [Arctogadus glacialis]